MIVICGLKLKIFVVKENQDFDGRIAVTPDVAKKLIDQGHQFSIEKSAGESAGFYDSDYGSVGAILEQRSAISNADVIFSVNPLENSDIKKLKKEAIVISIQEHFQNKEKVELLKDAGITSFALDLIPRTTRAQYMDVLSSQSSLAGYKAVIEAAHILNRGLPLMMTTAGTIPAARILVIGAGVAGLQAIATAKRLGAIVSAFDVRSAAKEQVESLGAKFVEVESSEKTDGVYAKEMSEEYKKAQEAKLRAVIANQDIIITTAQIPGRKAPIIIKDDMINTMKKGSLIIDLASKTGGNCESTVHGKTVEKNGVKIVAFENILNLISYDASRLFAKNILTFFELLCEKMKETTIIKDIDDEIIKGTLLTYNFEIFKAERK